MHCPGNHLCRTCDWTDAYADHNGHRHRQNNNTMILPYPARLIGTAALAAVGFAQLFRTHIEVIIGVLYLAAAAVWAVTIRINSRYAAGVSAGVTAVVFAGRAGAGVGMWNSNWSSAVIIVATWGALSALFAWASARTLKGPL